MDKVSLQKDLAEKQRVKDQIEVSYHQVIGQIVLLKQQIATLEKEEKEKKDKKPKE